MATVYYRTCDKCGAKIDDRKGFVVRCFPTGYHSNDQIEFENDVCGECFLKLKTVLEDFGFSAKTYDTEEPF